MKRASAAKKRSGAGRCEQAIRSYFGGILNGEITACEKMHQLAERVLRDLDNTDPLYPYHYREEFAAKHVTFIETFCRLPSGKLGRKFKLELFQLAILSVIFGFVDAEACANTAKSFGLWGEKTVRPRLRRLLSLTCSLTMTRAHRKSTTWLRLTIRRRRASTTPGEW
jgi:hypothetical protein